MKGKSLFEKVWENHSARILPNGQTQLAIDVHLIHEVTSPQAFGMLRDLGLKVRHPERTFATVDHIVPTDEREEPFSDKLADAMIKELRKNAVEFGITFFDIKSGKQGIVHVVGPEQGITQPGMTIACGDSHTATHGAFGAVALGIGTTQVRNVLATQSIALNKLKVRRINVDGKLGFGVYAKDVILHILKKLGANGGIGYAYEYGGEVFDNFSLDERMTVCNMSIEGGARCGYVNPDQKTFDYIKGRPYAPKGEEWEKTLAEWRALASDKDCRYDDVVNIDAKDIAPTLTWGVSPDQGLSIEESLPSLEDVKDEEELAVYKDALKYMRLKPGQKIAGTPIDVAFIGSCTNGRLSDFREAAKIVKGKKVAANVRAIAVPGSEIVSAMAEKEGIAETFRQAGFEWRGAGCSMCLAMNPDKLIGAEICASSSNRNFKGRQGSPTGRTLLMSPAMVAAAAINGKVSDAREFIA